MTLTVAILGLAFATTPLCLAQNLTIELNPNKSRYGPSDALIVVVTLRDASGVRAPSRWILVGDTWDQIRPNFNWRWYCTDVRGQVRLRYRIPTNPSWGNIYVGAAFLPWNLFVQKRIPIGP